MRVGAGAGAAASEHQGAALCRQTPSLPLLTRLLARCGAAGRNKAGWMLPLPGTQTRTDGGSLRPAPGCAGAPGRTAFVPAEGLPPDPSLHTLSPGGGAADGNLRLFSPKDPNPPQSDAGQGGGEGPREEKKTFLGALAGGPSVCPRQGWPSGPGRRRRSGPPPPLFLGGDPLPPPRAPQTSPPGRGAGWAERQKEAWRGWGRRDAAGEEAAMPPGRPLGSGGAPAAPGRRRAAQQAVAAAGGGRAHHGAGPT